MSQRCKNLKICSNLVLHIPLAICGVDNILWSDKYISKLGSLQIAIRTNKPINAFIFGTLTDTHGRFVGVVVTNVSAWPLVSLTVRSHTSSIKNLQNKSPAVWLPLHIAADVGPAVLVYVN